MGRRGEIWVVAQAVLLIFFFLAPQTGAVRLDNETVRFAGWLLAVAGASLLTWSAVNLGPSLTPLPRPVTDGKLVTTGAYHFLRHPIYFGVLLACFGISLATTNLFRLFLTLILFVFFDMKATREERWLEDQYIGYSAYKHEVKKLIPWLY